MSDMTKASSRWAEKLGLAAAPLFGERDAAPRGWEHHVMLDGGRGSFALTEITDLAAVEAENTEPNRSWIWSANLPHHVVLAGETALVARWDSVQATPLRAVQVEDRLEEFYRFLILDRVKTQLTVVEHAVTLFRRLRGLLDLKGIPETAAVDLFLLELSALSEPNLDPDLIAEHPEKLLPQISDEAREALKMLGPSLADAALEFASFSSGAGQLRLLPDLAVRHAGAAIFQEAHFELKRGGQGDLFFGADPAAVQTRSRGGVHFTPPALARILAEEALAATGTLHEQLTVLDPACGSGAFLYEALRAVGRRGYRGRIRLVGRDVSPYAIAMARFLLDRARPDWPHMEITVELAVADSLEDAVIWGTADVVLMNPPFLTWGDMTSEERERTFAMLGDHAGGKPDYCMAFVERALSSGQPGVVIGTLIPASLLSLEGSKVWRHSLAERAEIPLLCSFGDYGLFRYALVQVGAMVLRSRRSGPQDRPEITQTRAVWTAETTEATGNALRALRRLGRSPKPTEGEDWSVDVSPGSVPQGVDWRPRPWRLRRVLDRIAMTLRTTVGDVFSVTEGVRTGARSVFILTMSELMALPPAERAYFKPVAEGRNIRAGRIHKDLYVFFPTSIELMRIDNEEELRKHLPTYCKRLVAARDDLMSRRPVQRRPLPGRSRWWELNWPRKEFERGTYPKIVSAYFGQRGSFAFDETGEFVVVQGHAWLPKGRRQQSLHDWAPDLQRAYVALLNSRPFGALLAEFCPRVQGGQFNLSQRFVKRIPIPDLPSLMMDDMGVDRIVTRLAELQPLQLWEPQAGHDVDALITKLFGVPLEDWPMV